MRKRRCHNPKRRIASGLKDEGLIRLARIIRYVGNPEHKRNPGDFGLTPPSVPRLDKACCDEVGIVSKAEALRFLKEGVRKGLVSERWTHGFPQNIWSLTDDN